MSRVRNVAELGAGDGQLALRIFEQGFKVDIIDTEDWRDKEVKKANIPFHCIEKENKYEIPDNSIDLFVSYHTLEHIPKPALTLEEMIRVTRAGGYIFLNFNPLYNSPWGLHAYRTFYAPYPQFLLAEPTLQRFVDENGIYDLGVEREEFQYTNKWSLADYQNLITSLGDRIEVKFFRKTRDYREIWVVYRYLKCFWGRNLSFEELTTSGLGILLCVK